jgi:protein TonB
MDWSNKVELIGNFNFPKVAAKTVSYTLIMDVGIKGDGSVSHIKIQKSSGNPGVDEAAKNIVKKSAPFAPLPSELLNEQQVLVITRE